MYRLKEHLLSHFDDDVKIDSEYGDLIVRFLGSFENRIDEKWYSNKKSNNEDERLRIVEAASKIILEDIRGAKYETKKYKASTALMNNAAEDIPRTLHTFLNILLKSHKRGKSAKHEKKMKNKVFTAAHIIIKGVRPKSFISPVLLGLSTMIHRKYATKGLIHCRLIHSEQGKATESFEEIWNRGRIDRDAGKALLRNGVQGEDRVG